MLDKIEPEDSQEWQFILAEQQLRFRQHVKAVLLYFVLGVLLLILGFAGYIFIQSHYYNTRIRGIKPPSSTQCPLVVPPASPPITTPAPMPLLPQPLLPPVGPVGMPVADQPLPPPVAANTQTICIAEHAHGTHPGVLKDKHCFIAYGSVAVAVHRYHVLPKAHYLWTSYRYQSPMADQHAYYLPKNAVLAGQEPIVDHPHWGVDPNQSVRNLYICRANNDDKMTGKVVDGVCNVAGPDSSLQFSEYQVLVK